MIVPVADRHIEYAKQIAEDLRAQGVRVKVEERSESVGKKIREAELGRYPYMLVVGDRETEAGRSRCAPTTRASWLNDGRKVLYAAWDLNISLKKTVRAATPACSLPTFLSA